jgi:RimJ/RimL family protein N-acetyltransferase
MSMHHAGTQPIRTKRLILRRFTPADAAAAYHNWQTDPQVTKYLTWPPYTDFAQAQERIAWVADQYAQPNFYYWAIQLADQSAAVIGNIAVVRTDENIRSLAIGYVSGQAWWGHGYMPETLRAVIDFLFTNTDVQRIEATHDVRNPNSGKVMAKAGMRKEGVLRQRGRNNTGVCDEAMYAILRSDWTKKAAPSHGLSGSAS